MTQLSRIWEPLQIGPTAVKHRIMVAPHGQCYAEDHRPSERTIAYFRERAAGGAALLAVESTSASRYLSGAQPGGSTSGWRMSAYQRENIDHFAKLANTVHEHDSKLFIQFSTGGVNDVGRAWTDTWHPVWGPSRVPSPIMNEIPLEMDRDKIRELVEDYGTSANNMAEAGLDGVEIHAGHGYLPMQFLSPAFNKRTDEYGGSDSNRVRLVLQLGESIRERVGTDVTVGIRLSFDEYIGDAGVSPDLAERYLELLVESGLFDYFSISCGSWYSLHQTVPPMGAVDDAFLLPHGIRAKEIVGDRGKVFLCGRILDLPTAEHVLSEGGADMVAMVRAHIVDPFLIQKTLDGRADEVMRCTGANECLAAPAKGRQVTCMMNPATGREREWGHGTLKLTPAQKRVLVVGGGPGGMKVAGVAAMRGHQVLLFEQADSLGGHLNLLKRFPTRGRWQTVIDNLEEVLVRNHVDVQLGVTSTAEFLMENKPDVIICATGSTWDCTGFSSGRPDRTSIPGVEQSNVIDVGTASEKGLADPKSMGSRVMILDETGQYLPLGLAEVLGQAGVAVEVLSRFATVGDQLVGTQDLPWLLPRLAEAGVELNPGQFIEKIKGRTVEAYELWSKRPRFVEEVDTVVLAMLRTPNDSLFKGLQAEQAVPVYRIGDATSPRSVSEAIYDGEKLGRAI